MKAGGRGGGEELAQGTLRFWGLAGMEGERGIAHQIEKYHSCWEQQGWARGGLLQQEPPQPPAITPVGSAALTPARPNALGAGARTGMLWSPPAPGRTQGWGARLQFKQMGQQLCSPNTGEGWTPGRLPREPVTGSRPGTIKPPLSPLPHSLPSPHAKHCT